jgi:small-conductance mechanosensitive channel
MTPALALAPASVPLVALQTATPTGTPVEAGPDRLVDLLGPLTEAGWFLAGFLVTFAVGWYLLEPAASRVVRNRNRNNQTIQEALSRYLRLAVVLLAVLVGAALAGYVPKLGNSALIIAAVTVVVGAAGQTVVGSLVSGLVLVNDPEFNVGDYIQWADREGVVRSITLRVTRIQTPDGALVTVPNTKLTSEPVTRPYEQPRYRIIDRLDLAYDEDVDVALSHLEAAAHDVEEIAAEPSPEAYIDELRGDSIALNVHYWVAEPRNADLFAVRSQFAQAARRRLEGIDMHVGHPAHHDLTGRFVIEEDGGGDGDGDDRGGENVGEDDRGGDGTGARS